MDDKIKILELLNSKKNVLLMGAPGTGKSRIMNEVAEAFVNGGTRLAQAFAFCSATDTNEIVLVYPADDPADIPGYVKKCSTYYVKNVMIHVVQVAFGSIKEKGGIYAFSANLSSGIEEVLKSS